MSENAERLAAWFKEPHEPFLIQFDRQCLFTLLVALRLSRHSPGMEDGLAIEVVSKLIEAIETLLPADLAFMAMYPTGRAHHVREVCDCGRPLIGADSTRLGRCEICLEDSGI